MSTLELYTPVQTTITVGRATRHGGGICVCDGPALPDTFTLPDGAYKAHTQYDFLAPAGAAYRLIVGNLARCGIYPRSSLAQATSKAPGATHYSDLPPDRIPVIMCAVEKTVRGASLEIGPESGQVPSPSFKKTLRAHGKCAKQSLTAARRPLSDDLSVTVLDGHSSTHYSLCSRPSAAATPFTI